VWILTKIHFVLLTILSQLLERFWPLLDWPLDYIVVFIDTKIDSINQEDIIVEDEMESYPFYGPTKDKSKLSSNPFQNVLLGDFILYPPSKNNYLFV